MLRKLLVGALLTGSLWAFGMPVHAQDEEPIDTIAFGSCAEQNAEQPIWSAVVESSPDVFVFLGDNVYGDTEDMDELRAEYEKLGAIEGYQALLAATDVIATWDDHDYGANDAGVEYPMKEESKQIFLDFFGEPAESDRRLRDGGIYTSYTYGPESQRVQIILLDTRWDRTPINMVSEAEYAELEQIGAGPYTATTGLDARMLGEDQWSWLEERLREPADLRIIGTSIPFLQDGTGWETWTNFPDERDRLIGLIDDTSANGVVFITGDTHWAQFSKRTSDVPYALWELNSSGLTENWEPAAPDDNRLGGSYSDDNFGLIRIDWSEADPEITLEIRGVANELIMQNTIRLSELQLATTSAPAESAAADEDEVAEPELVANLPVVTARLETRPILDMDAKDLPDGARMGDMDDPAIWVHPTDAAQSIVAGVLKEGGLEVYDLEGNVLQSLSPAGVRYNNVDIIYDVELGGETIDLMAVTDRFQDKFAFFRVDPTTRKLVDVSDPANPLLFTPEGQESDETTTAYGIALYRSPQTGNVYAFANRRETGELAQWLLVDNGAGQVAIEQVRTFSLPIPEGGEVEDAQTEGMVADQELGQLYIGQENAGVWKIDAEPEGSNDATLLDAVRPAGEILEADVEGLTIYYGPDGAGYLLVSSQGDNTMAVFTREGDNEYLGSFQVGAGDAADGVQESDGAMVLNVALGEQFPNGILLLQDGFNLPAVMVEDDGELENVSTSLKFVDWADVANAFDPPLLIDTSSYHPRNR